jgi:hypothetical protein
LLLFALFDEEPQIVATKKEHGRREAVLSSVRQELNRSIQPIFIRLPAPKSRCPYTGLSRSALADLCVPSKANQFKPPVKSIAPKKHKHAKRAARLIDFESLVTWLKAQEYEQIQQT